MFKKYIDLIPNDPNPYDSYAELLLEMGEFDQSIEMYNKALAINPNFFFSHVGIAANLNLKGEHVKARAQLQELWRTAKRPAQKRMTFTSMAMSYFDEGNYKLALREIQNQYEFSVSEKDTAQMGFDLYTLGNLHFEIGEYEKALELFDQANNLMENSSLPENLKRNNKNNYYYNSARAEMNLGRMDKAQKHIDDYAAIITSANPNQQRLLHFLKGRFAFLSKNYELAESELRQANQQSPYVMYYLGQLFEETGEIEKAVSFYNKAAYANLANNLAYTFVRTKALDKITKLSNNS